MADIETDAIMTEAELLARLDRMVDTEKKLDLLRSQIAAHRRAEREACLAAMPTPPEGADREGSLYRLGRAHGLEDARKAVALPTSEPEHNG